MGKRLLVFLVLFFAFASTLVLTAGSNRPVYWLSYERDGLPAGRRYLLKIDELGSILTQPTMVVSSADLRNDREGATALGLTANGNVILWIGDATRRDYPGGDIYKAVFTPGNLSRISFGLTKQHPSDAFVLQSTHGSAANSLVFRKKLPSGDFLVKSQVSANGVFTGKFSITSEDLSDCELNGPVCAATMSWDGHAAAYALPGDRPGLTNLWYQRLNDEGMIGKPVMIGSFKNPDPRTSGQIGSVDVSNITSPHIRFVAYMWMPNRLNDPSPDTLFIQPVNAMTGKALGDRIRVNTSQQFDPVQSVAIDPLGRFVIFAVNTRFKEPLPHNSDVLLFQALDALGRPSGNVKILAENDVAGGIDLMMLR